MNRQKVNLVKDSDQNDENSVIVLGNEDNISLSNKELEKQRKDMISSLEDSAKIETLHIQHDARSILNENLGRFKSFLSKAEDGKEFSTLMRSLTEISGVSKKDNNDRIMIPIQINLDI